MKAVGWKNYQQFASATDYMDGRASAPPEEDIACPCDTCPRAEKCTWTSYTCVDLREYEQSKGTYRGE